MEQLEIRKYEGFDVSFLLAGRNVKVNATEMAKVFGKLTENFMELKSTKAFIQAANLPLFRGRLGLEDGDDLVENRGRAGLWMHRVLALKFAAWLDAKFEVWVYITIDELMFGQLPELVQELVKAEDSFNDAQKALHESVEWKAYQEAENYKKKVKSSISKTQKNQLDIFKQKL